MNQVWKWALAASVMAGLLTGRAEQLATALSGAGTEAVSLVMTLLGTMVIWCGLLEILSDSGDLQRLGRLTGRTASVFFRDLKDEACWEAVGTNLVANFLGLGNAATPAGVRAAELLSGMGTEGIRALSVLLVLNNAGVQLLPSTVMALRQAAGSAEPGSIWLPSLAGGAVSACVGTGVLWLMQRREGRRGR